MRIAVAGSSGLIGAQLCHIARLAGHEVVGLSRTDGVDLLDSDALGAALTGVDVVIDVTRPTATDLASAREFYDKVARNLAIEGQRAGVSRTVVLSIVGIDRSQDYDWYIATLEHERATLEQAPGPRVLRATQFHEFPGQILDRALAHNEHVKRVSIMDIPIQPIDSGEVAEALLDLAIDADVDVQEIAGPREERLVDLVADLAAYAGLDLEVEAVPGPASMAAGSLLPDPEVPTVGIDWQTWLDEHGR